MATHKPVLASPDKFASALLAEREVGPRAQAIAAEASERLGATPVTVYVFDATSEPRWTSKGSVGEVKAPAQCEALTLAMVAEQAQPLLFSGAELVREHYAHLDIRRTIVSLAYVPLMDGDRLLGAIEAVSLERALGKADLAALAEVAELSSLAIAAALSYENERNNSFETITRLTSFYDIEKVFHSTLQMHELLPIITSKVREILPCDAVNLWMIEGDGATLMARDGQDPTTEIGASGDDIVQSVADRYEPVLVNDPAEPALAARRAANPDFVRNLLVVPVATGESLVGVLECVNKAGGEFDEDDQFLLTTIAESAGGALHNASLLEAEKKIEILEMLVDVSQEITATLNLDRVLQVLVNAPQRIMEYDRGAVALYEKRKVIVKAVSGKTEVVQSDPQIKILAEMMEWSLATEDPLYITTSESGQVVAEREETRVKFAEYFKLSNAHSWYSIPLADDQGRMGTLVFESSRNEFLGEAQFEIIKVLAAQATVALRNASLYTEVPFIGVLEPFLHKKQQLAAMDATRRGKYIALAVAAAIFLAVVPLPMRVQGSATVAPQRTAQVQAEEDGVVRHVYVHEGDPVKKGTVLADMEDWQYRSAVAEAQAKRDAAVSAMNRALANNDGAEAGVQRVQAEFWKAEVERAQQRLDHSRLRSPIDGIVSTPYVEDMAGRKLDAGDTFAQVVNTSQASVDVAVEQSDLPLVNAGQGATVKLTGFPLRRFKGAVTVVSPASTAAGDARVFYARVDVPNNDGLIRSGMQGQAKVFTGWRPAGYVMFRGIAMWGWSKLWNWFGW
jgi:RND family efflux transporter MFP subunit